MNWVPAGAHHATEEEVERGEDPDELGAGRSPPRDGRKKLSRAEDPDELGAAGAHHATDAGWPDDVQFASADGAGDANYLRSVHEGTNILWAEW